MTPLPQIPRRGLEEALRTWSGRGSLLTAIAAPEWDPSGRAWEERDTLARARRILWEQMIPLVAQWPERRSTWLDAIPIQRRRDAVDLAFPGPGTRWARARLSGYPMRRFPSNRSSLETDPLTTGVLAWTLRELEHLVASAPDATGETSLRALARAEEALALLDAPELAGAEPRLPRPDEVRAVRAQGRPWRGLADVCDQLRALYDVAATSELSLRLLAPDEEYAWRLFHLGVLGELLLALRGADADFTSLRPIGLGAAGPAFRVTDAKGELWDLWFEGAGAWATYGVAEPYQLFATAVQAAPNPLGADLVLVRVGDRALLFECKYSSDVSYVAREGYHQVVSYASEMVDLISSPNVTAYVVAPSDVVLVRREVQTGGLTVGLTAPEDLDVIVENLLNASDDD